MIATNPAHLHRLVSATFFAAVIALGASALGYPAIAGAAIDTEKYNDCLQRGGADTFNGAVEKCCADAGGHVVYYKSDGHAACLANAPTADDCVWVTSTECPGRLTPPGFDPSRLPQAEVQPTDGPRPVIVDPNAPVLTTAP